MHIKSILFALGVMITPVQATTVIKDDGGGIIRNYLEKYKTMKISGEKIIIDGYCGSACTLLLGLLPKEQWCTTPKVQFGFHTASITYFDKDMRPIKTEHDQNSTNMMWKLYPVEWRKEIKKKGWNGDDPSTPHVDLVVIDYSVAKNISRTCDENDYLTLPGKF